MHRKSKKNTHQIFRKILIIQGENKCAILLNREYLMEYFTTLLKRTLFWIFWEVIMVRKHISTMGWVIDVSTKEQVGIVASVKIDKEVENQYCGLKS